MQRTFTQLNRRSDRITGALRAGAVRPTREIFRELAELTIKLEEAPVKPIVIARLVVIRQNGTRTIVEIHQDATFSSFYRFYRQEGKRRSTKQLIRQGCRNEGLPLVGAIRSCSGLDTIAAKLLLWGRESNAVVDTKFYIFKPRIYRRLLSVSPDQLGLTKTSRLPIYSPVHS